MQKINNNNIKMNTLMNLILIKFMRALLFELYPFHKDGKKNPFTV